MSHSPGDDHLLEDIHVLLAKILAELDRVCRTLDIPYVVYGGTAIGAVRHHGFIPWDDDADVMMTREDYERFLTDAPAVMGDRFRLDNLRNRDDFPFMFTKMVLKDTLLVPEAARSSAYRMPFFLDILPVDRIPDDEAAFRAMSRSSWWWGRLLFLRGTPRPYLIGITGWKRALIYTATSVVHWGLRLLHVSPRLLQRRWEHTVRRYEHVPTSRMADFTMRDPENWVVTLDELYPAQDAPFEGFTVRIPRDYDSLLRRGYGDYMQLPPVTERRNHTPYEVSLGPYTAEVAAARKTDQDDA